MESSLRPRRTAVARNGPARKPNGSRLVSLVSLVLSNCGRDLWAVQGLNLSPLHPVCHRPGDKPSRPDQTRATRCQARRGCGGQGKAGSAMMTRIAAFAMLSLIVTVTP